MAAQQSLQMTLVATQYKSPCCSDVEFLASTSSSGEFVQAVCRSCCSRRHVGRAEFRRLAFSPRCSGCEASTDVGESRYGSYGYSCARCQVFVPLGHQVPTGDELERWFSRSLTSRRRTPDLATG